MHRRIGPSFAEYQYGQFRKQERESHCPGMNTGTTLWRVQKS